MPLEHSCLDAQLNRCLVVVKKKNTRKQAEPEEYSKFKIAREATKKNACLTMAGDLPPLSTNAVAVTLHCYNHDRFTGGTKAKREEQHRGL